MTVLDIDSGLVRDDAVRVWLLLLCSFVGPARLDQLHVYADADVVLVTCF